MGITQTTKRKPKTRSGILKLPQRLGLQISDGINASRASTSLEMLVPIVSDAWRTLSCRDWGLGAAQSFQPTESQGFKCEIEIRECFLFSAGGRAGLGSWMGSDVQCWLVQCHLWLSLLGMSSVTAALSAGHRCPFGQIYVTPRPCTVTNATGNNEGSRCTLFFNYYYIAIYK